MVTFILAPSTGGTAMDTKELEPRALARARAERVRVVKLAATNRYLARSRTVEPGAYFELFVSPWGHIRCTCPGFEFRRMCKHVMALRLRLSREVRA
jgi:hypothetical protein